MLTFPISSILLFFPNLPLSPYAAVAGTWGLALYICGPSHFPFPCHPPPFLVLLCSVLLTQLRNLGLTLRSFQYDPNPKEGLPWLALAFVHLQGFDIRILKES